MRLNDSLVVQQLDHGEAVIADGSTGAEIVLPPETLLHTAAVLRNMADRWAQRPVTIPEESK